MRFLPGPFRLQEALGIDYWAFLYIFADLFLEQGHDRAAIHTERIPDRHHRGDTDRTGIDADHPEIRQ